MGFLPAVREEVGPVLLADILQHLLLVLQLSQDRLDQPLLPLQDLQTHVAVRREVPRDPARRDLVVAVSRDDHVLPFDDFARQTAATR